MDNISFSIINPVPKHWDDQPKKYRLRLSDEKQFSIEFDLLNTDNILEKFNNAYLDFVIGIKLERLSKIPEYQTIKRLEIKKLVRPDTAMIHVLDNRKNWINIGYRNGTFCYFVPGENGWSAEKLWERIRQSYYLAYQFNKFLYGELPELLEDNIK